MPDIPFFEGGVKAQMDHLNDVVSELNRVVTEIDKPNKRGVPTKFLCQEFGQIVVYQIEALKVEVL